MPAPHPDDIVERLSAAFAGHYAIERELGRGGMSVVYLARDVKHDRHVAIKVLRPELTASVGAERFQREIQIAARAEHIHILPLYDSGTGEGLAYYVMPCVREGSLRERLNREGALAIAEVVRIAREVAEGLTHAHGLGIVHRDVKPENILFVDGHAVIADFGIAHAYSEAGGETLTDYGVAIGTPAYMSPEQASGERRIDQRTDIYALGCVVYEMLSGGPPFEGPTTQAVLAKQISERVPSLKVVRPDIPTGVVEVVERALAKVAADRFGSAIAFAEALEAGVQRPEPTGRRSRRAILAAASVVAALAVLGSLVWPPPFLRSTAPWSLVSGQPAPVADLDRIAVLYFDDGSADGSLSWLAAGLTDELIDRLGEVDGLTVISQNGVRQFSGLQVGTDSIGRALKVGLLVNGTVEPAGDSVRVSVRLIEPSSAVLLDRFAITRARAEPLALRNGISEQLQRLLRRTIGEHVALSTQRNEASNDAAWELTQRASDLAHDAESLALENDFVAALGYVSRADSLLQVAERLDRNWLLPTIRRAELAWLWARVIMGSHPGSLVAVQTGANRVLAAGIAHATRALVGDSTNAQALNVRGRLLTRLWGFTDDPGKDTLLAEAFRDVTLATEIDPAAASAWYTLTEIEGYLGETARARLAAQRALEADRYAGEASNVLAWLLYDALDEGRLDLARRYCDEGKLTFPDEENFLECELTLLAYSGQGEADVRRAWQLLRDLDTVIAVAHGRLHRRMYVAAVLARSGLRDSSLAVVGRTRASVSDEQDMVQFLPVEAFVWKLLGERARAADLLSLYFETDPRAKQYWLRHPWFVDVVTTREFARFVEP